MGRLAEQGEEIRYRLGTKERYKQRKETIERVFADGKEKHGMRYTQYRGRAKVEMELDLLFGCMNLKKLAIWKWRIKWGGKYRSSSLQFFFSSIKFKLENWKWVTKRFADMIPRTVLSTV